MLKKQSQPMDDDAMEEKNETKEDKEPEQYEVENAAQDLLRAETHKKNPKLMKRVHQHLSKTADSINKIRSVDDIRQAYKDKQKEGQDY